MIDIAEGPGRDLKNIRQIGTPAEGDRIYIENAAYARVHEETYEERRVFIFMGHTECEQGVYMTFVEAAIPVRDMEFSQNLPRWGTHAWSDVFREIKRSYENSIIVGWALDCKGYPPRLTAELEAIHREQFGGAHQVLFLMDSMEGEEYFYLHKGNRLQPKNGFYIYYARELHEIRIPDVTIELPRRGTRQMLPEILTESKKENEKEECSSSKSERKPTSYAMAAAIALLLVLAGVGIWQQRIHIPGLEQTVETIGEKIRHVSQPAEVLVGTEKNIVEEQTESAKSTETISEPMQLIPIEEVPAGAVKKAEEAMRIAYDVKKKLKDLALFLEQLRSHFICIEYVQIDNVEEQRKIKEDLIQNTEEVEKVLAIREEMDAKQELKSKYAKRSVETTSGVERLQLRVAIEKLEEEVYELREMLLQSKLDAELLLEKDLKKKLKISKMCERLLSSLENQYEQLNEEKRELRAVYDTKVKAVAAEDMEELIEVRQAVRDEETHRARAELLAKYGEAFKDRFFDEAVEKVDCEMRGKVYVKREQTIESPKGAKLYPEQKSR